MIRSVEETLRSVVKGDRSAVAWLYDRFAPSIHRRLQARYGYLSGVDADDLLHDTFVRVLRNHCRLVSSFLEQTAGSALTEAVVERFLWDHACGVAADRRRMAARRKKRVVPLAEAWDPQDTTDEETASIARDTLRRLFACVAGAGQRLLLYFKLRYLHGLSPAEISHTTGWSRKATYKLRQALNSAVEQCAERLGIVVG